MTRNNLICSCQMRWLKENFEVMPGIFENVRYCFDFDYCEHVITHENKLFDDLDIPDLFCEIDAFCDLDNCDCYTDSPDEDARPTLLYCSHRNATETPSPLAPSALVIHLEYNNFTTLEFHSESIEHAKMQTTELYLHHSNIHDIPRGTLDMFKKVRRLELQSNKLKVFAFELLQNMIDLEVLILTDNLLAQVTLTSYITNTPIIQSNFPVVPFSNDTNATVMPTVSLSLDHNNIQYLPSNILQVITSSNLGRLSLGGNPWNCTECRGATMQAWLLNLLENTHIHVADLDKIFCHNDGVPHKSLLNLSEGTLKDYALCHNHSWGPNDFIVAEKIAAIVVSLMIIFTIVATSMYEGRRHIRVMVISAFPWMKRWRKELPVVNDIFIIHNQTNRDLMERVLREIVRPLFHQHLYHVIFPEMFRPGDKGDTLVAAISNSRCSVIILDQHYKNDEWLEFAFMRAHQRSLDDSRHRVIILTVDRNIPTQNMNQNMKAYLECDLCIDMNSQNFWRYFLYRLPHARSEGERPNPEAEQLNLHQDLHTICMSDVTPILKNTENAM